MIRTEVDTLQGEVAVKVTLPPWLLPFTRILNRTLPLPPETMPVCPGARLTEICEVLVFPVALIVVVPLELFTDKVTVFVTRFPTVA